MACKLSVLAAKQISHGPGLFNSPDICRFARISHGQDQVAIHDLEGVSELHSNPFIHRAFALFDTDSDGMLSLQDFTKAIDVLGHLNNSDQQLKCMRSADWNAQLTSASLELS